MQRFFLFLLLIITSSLCGQWDDLFPSGDPVIHQHVHTISGHLQLSIEDTSLQGAEPFPLIRTYNSSGALERSEDCRDLTLKNLRRGWLVQGGWSFLPHTNLLFLAGSNTKHRDEISLKESVFQTAEPNGAIVIYAYSHREKIKKNTYYYYYKPKKIASAHTGFLSSRNDSQNNLLRIKVKEKHPTDFEVTIMLANGGTRFYGKLSKEMTFYGSCYFKILWEELPSKRFIEYQYDVKDKLIHIAIKNPSREKTLSWIHLNLLELGVPFAFKATTSDNRSILYKAVETQHREYFSEILSQDKKKEYFVYSNGGEKMGARISEIYFEDDLEMRAHYYDSNKHYWKRDESFYKKHFFIDKVKRLEAPVGPNNTLQTIAEFFYHPGVTEVHDAEGSKICYYYEEDRITRINHFHKEGPLYSRLEFLWENNRLKAKILYDEKEKPVFAKTFVYDDRGNVLQEALWGQLTGLADSASFSVTSNGSIENAECYRKYYEYDPRTHLLLRETEEDGLTFVYKYKPDTDLVTAKLTQKADVVLKREFFLYDQDNNLRESICDDGRDGDLHNMQGVLERQINRYEVDPQTGLVQSLTELFVNVNSLQEIPSKKHVYFYDEHHLCIQEDVYDQNLEYRYSLHTKYDQKGHVVAKTTPSGQENRYSYDKHGHLIEALEVGKQKKLYTYDASGRVISCTEIDDEGKSKTAYSKYDAKGRVLSQTDFFGNETVNTYDTFGRCLKTELPALRDDKGEIYTPFVQCTYDVCGNLTSHTNPRGETTYTKYNVFQKPIEETHADGSKTRYIYAKNGALRKTINANGTETHYSHDPFLRVTSQKIYSSQGALLAEETRSYNAFHLLSHTDAKGLTTRYTYDSLGRKQEEITEDRKSSYTYDSLGFLQTTSFGDFSKTEKHDLQGSVIEKWEKRGSQIENHTLFFYDEKNLLIKTIRTTSEGEAADFFFYDGEKRLCKHIDPLGHVTEFSYFTIVNDLRQTVLCKTTVNALGYKTLETYEASLRLCSKEKQDDKGTVLSQEEVFYDRAGNPAKKTFSVYLDGTFTKKITHTSEYDSMRRVKKEVEAGIKTTSYDYNTQGTLSLKTLPSGISFRYTYDELGRLLSLQSSDGSVNYEYFYNKDPQPIRAKDLLTGKSIYRSYNLFGDLIQEQTPQGNFYWDYDTQGRCVHFTLPDNSSITREYEDGHLHIVARKDPEGVTSYFHTYLKIDPNNHIEEESLIYNLGTVHTFHDLLERSYLQSSSWNRHQVSYDPLSRVDHISSTLFPEKALAYDPLNQIKQEGDSTYRFDSMGNNSLYEVNDCNEILTTSDSKLLYDKDGYPIERSYKDHTSSYTYDALGRLTSITSSSGRKVIYTYDPFSRLASKEVQDEETSSNTCHFFLYDQNKEIGAIDKKGDIFQLKVLGLGVGGSDIGAAVAIELNHFAYAPIHDLHGNCIGILDSSGNCVETYDISVFGNETCSSLPCNPWRFASKRHDEGLIFFGLRFYDSSLQRWLTPDPSGFADGPNLYVYVLNSPLNRLDLFGLFSYEDIRPSVQITAKEIGDRQIQYSLRQENRLVKAKAIVEGIPIDWAVCCNQWHKIQFSAEELQSGTINLFDHFTELLPKEGSKVGLVSFQNGMNTSYDEFIEMCQSVVDKGIHDALFIGMYNPSTNAVKDFFRVIAEKCAKKTPIVKVTHKMLQTIAEAIHQHNPQMAWLDIRHSEGALIGYRAIEMMDKQSQKIMKKHFECLCVGPARMIPSEYGRNVHNVFSNKDHVTKNFAQEWEESFTYNIKIVPCISTPRKLPAFIGDHAFMGETYQQAVEDQFSDIKTEIGFYDTNSR